MLFVNAMCSNNFNNKTNFFTAILILKVVDHGFLNSPNTELHYPQTAVDVLDTLILLIQFSWLVLQNFQHVIFDLPALVLSRSYCNLTSLCPV